MELDVPRVLCEVVHVQEGLERRREARRERAIASQSIGGDRLVGPIQHQHVHRPRFDASLQVSQPPETEEQRRRVRTPQVAAGATKADLVVAWIRVVARGVHGRVGQQSAGWRGDARSSMCAPRPGGESGQWAVSAVGPCGKRHHPHAVGA